MGLRVLEPARLVLNNVRVAAFNSNPGVWLDGSNQGQANTITNSLIENNVVVGIRVQEADLTVSTSTISGNGGGAELFDTGHLNINDSTIRDNTASFGGGIYVDGSSSAQVMVHRSLIHRAASLRGMRRSP